MLSSPFKTIVAVAMPGQEISDQAEHLEQTALLLASGFQTLLSEVQSLANGERQLKQKLDHAQQEVSTLSLQEFRCRTRHQISSRSRAVRSDERLPYHVLSDLYCTLHIL